MSCGINWELIVVYVKKQVPEHEMSLTYLSAQVSIQSRRIALQSHDLDSRSSLVVSLDEHLHQRFEALSGAQDK